MKKQYIKNKIINKNKKRKFMNSYQTTKEILQELIKKPLIKQRTPEWFKLREDRLTASDLYDAVKNPLSLAKRKLKGNTFNSSGIPALKWGVMFEPIAIQIYSHINKIKIHEFGLIINDDISNFGASPDGITDEGIMIEIKCPYSRKIICDKIPDKYQYQIQGQLAVCKLDNCDYVECEFIEYKLEDEYISAIIDDEYKHGIIAEIRINGEYEYKYSNQNQTKEENLIEMNKYKNKGYNLIYWNLKLINIQRVTFNRNLWDNEIVNKINEFIEIYKQEKNNNPLNQFLNDNDD